MCKLLFCAHTYYSYVKCEWTLWNLIEKKTLLLSQIIECGTNQVGPH